MHDSASSATLDNGLIFPAITGRYVRPVDGILHTKWFGIKGTGTSDQHAALQLFVNAVLEDGYVGFIDPGIIYCGGNPIYINSSASDTGPSNAPSAFSIRGAGKDVSIVRNAVVSVGDIANFLQNNPIEYPIAASEFSLSQFSIDGYLDLWAPQAATVVDRLGLKNPPSAFLRPYGGGSLDGYLCNIDQSLSVTFLGVYVQAGANGTSAATNGVRINNSVNFTWLTGGFSGTASEWDWGQRRANRRSISDLWIDPAANETRSHFYAF